MWRCWALTRLRFLAVGMSVAHGGPALLVHGPKAGSTRVHGGPSPSSFLLGSAHVHRVQGCAAQLAPSPLFLPRRAPAGDVLTGELPQKLRHPTEVGKSLPAPWRLQRWGQGDGWCFLSHWSRRTAARAQPACGNGAGAAALADSMVRVGITMLQWACWAGRGVLQGLRWLWPRWRPSDHVDGVGVGAMASEGRHSGVCRLLRIRVDAVSQGDARRP